MTKRFRSCDHPSEDDRKIENVKSYILTVFTFYYSLVRVSDIFVTRFAKIWQTTETYSPQTFSVTAAVVAPAVAICLNSLFLLKLYGCRS